MSSTVNANGNLVARGTDSFGYDQANRLTSATIGGATSTYAYDGDGKRASRTVGGSTTSYLYDTNRGLPVLLDDGQRKYVWGLGLAYAVDTTGAVQVYHTDGLGSVRAITDASGSVVQTYQTDAFGVETQSQGSVSQPFQYTGEPRDAETGFIYLRARVYDPPFGRFLQRDRLPGVRAVPCTLNRYTYVRNNPVNQVDPSGLKPDECGGPPDGLPQSRLENPLPDYYSLTVNVAIPNPLTLTLVGWSGSVTVDRYGRWYGSYLGATVGKSATGVSGSVTVGYLWQWAVPQPTALGSFIQGPSVAAGGGYWGGGQVRYSLTARCTQWALEGGAFSPQGGVSAGYTEPLPLPWPPSWWPQ